MTVEINDKQFNQIKFQNNNINTEALKNLIINLKFQLPSKRKELLNQIIFMVKVFLLKIILINMLLHKVIAKIFQSKNKDHRIHICRINKNSQEINKNNNHLILIIMKLLTILNKIKNILNK